MRAEILNRVKGAVIIAILLSSSVCLPLNSFSRAGEIDIYAPDWSLQKRIDSQGRVYDKNCNSEGNVKGGKIYDRDWNLKGHIQNGVIYDRNWNVKGRIEGGRIYDRNWDSKGVIRKR